ncbi:ammonia-forming cytochrome c nitrite reductase subunit c552 [Heliobacillus mobilis]|uniref:nitrite reductase (cytochrome; ammonia-forming) n=1 Tax=Heliobacterium mobile TaxID=28064 RepID=A0A6I3SPN7_HELMO|nr:ammonia-forming cytochrome c nitrite reductase subunit c552 [Heliobacterium mobile]MTV51020.1 ammonia-forming cytochrome c nitrite reductase subunit c552 [Heliobacterium mobile]
MRRFTGTTLGTFRKNFKPIILLAWLIIPIIFIASSPGCTPKQRQEPSQGVEIGEFEADPAVWGKKYPDHYDTYLQNNMTARTEYGGSDKYSKLEREPLLKTLFSGYGFSKEYTEDRGHTYSLEDIRMIDPARKSAGTCITCKTANFKELYNKYGESYYTQPITHLLDEAKHPIACIDCHDPKTNALVITRPALKEAFARQGKDITKATRNEMRSLVCAQCHVEYYFQTGTKKLTFPWDKGFRADDILQYYQELGFTDWEHADAKTPMLKAQHPDYELNQNSTHQRNGVSCSDCHMPYVRIGTSKISSHWMTSPLRYISEACGTCHRQSEDYLKERILYTQRRVYDQLIKGEQVVAGAIESISSASKLPTVNAAKLTEARSLHRQAQWYLDFISAENSMGFHNPQEALRLLSESQRLAGESRIRALEALSGASLPPLPSPGPAPGLTSTQEDKSPKQ